MPESLAALLKYGYQSLAALLFMEAIGLPVPGAIVLLAAGAACATGAMRPGIAVVVAFSAMLTGDILLFTLGRVTGWALLGFLCRLSLNPETCVLRAAESFHKRGRTALLFTKFIPGINTMAAPLSGSMNMRPEVFVGFDFGGACLYIFAFAVPGYLFSEFLKSIVRGVQAFRNRSGMAHPYGFPHLYGLPLLCGHDAAKVLQVSQGTSKCSGGSGGRTESSPHGGGRCAQPRLLRQRCAAN